MPELPEVETTRRGIQPLLQNQRIRELRVRERRLRWPVADGVEAAVAGQTISAVQRRAKYLLLALPKGTLILHLGMSGSLRVLDDEAIPGAHDHIDLRLSSGRLLRLNDPRRFGSLHWTEEPIEDHWLIRDLGPEPLSDDFGAEALFKRSRGRRLAIKNFLMDGHTVVGVGNIYASEALFRAGIRPGLAAGRVSAARYAVLVNAVKQVLAEAIKAGGTTLRDFEQPSGKPGYFRIQLAVYGRQGQPCPNCNTAIRSQRIGQRSSFYCPSCQR